jgi:hypothetical protein
MGNSGFIVVMVAVTNFKESWLDLEVALPLPQSGFYHPHTRHQLHIDGAATSEKNGSDGDRRHRKHGNKRRRWFEAWKA